MQMVVCSNDNDNDNDDEDYDDLPLSTALSFNPIQILTGNDLVKEKCSV